MAIVTGAGEVSPAEPPRRNEGRGMMENVHILIVDDDSIIRETLSMNFEDQGVSVHGLSSGEALLEHLKGGETGDLILLDWKMGQFSGLDTLREMRRAGHEIPVIFLTSLTDQIYEEAALATGALDFIDKSRSFSILLHRVRTVLAGRRNPIGADMSAVVDDDAGTAKVRIGHLLLDPEVGRAYWQDQLVPLTLTEFQIVHALATEAGRDTRYRDIYDLVHGDGFHAGAAGDGYRANVRGFIKRIRRKFEEIDETFSEIENYPGFGYRWRAQDTGGGVS
ncbi:Response regulator consisting of a CheY-like receiver domain and a winged-helix DNA-binding domain [alpha proteobacterium BAL199]|jgi:two-component system, OmpR family, response regulator ChvI|nr:Response regulator consisting of a CheY-like receiver domain and a winged-helix DNA-binding domain [alpha proteobacterium BAL199]